MSLKIKNTLILTSILLLIAIAGGVYSFVFQKGKLDELSSKKEKLEREKYDPVDLQNRLNDVKFKAAELDSILAARKFNIPKAVAQTKFFNFINKTSFSFSPEATVNIEYADSKTDKDFNYFTYKISGTGEYNDLYKLIYAIEQSKELKKISKGTINSYLSVDDEGIPHYMVNFAFEAQTYFANDDRFSSATLVENNLTPAQKYDIFYPLIRNELPPNLDGLLEVEGAKLLALLPEGAYLSDSKGNSFVLWEGDKVYLGYLTKIDYDKNRVSFILNKGGIIEKINLQLETEENKKSK